MPTLFDYDSFDSFFLKNKAGSLSRFRIIHDNFRLIFNQVLKIGRTNFSSKQRGTAVAFYLRAGKYLYVAHELALTGHTEESRIILRSVIELILIGFLVSKEEAVYKLWLECFEERKSRTSEKGRIEVKDFANKKYKIASIVSKYKKGLDLDKDVQYLLRMRGEFSTYYSHENLFNVTPRMEQGESDTEIYIGTSYQSKNDRIIRNIELTVDILKNLEASIKGLL